MEYENDLGLMEETAPIMRKDKLDQSLKEVQQTLNNIFDIQASQPLADINPKQKKMLEIKQRKRQKYLEALEKEEHQKEHQNKTKINKNDYFVDSHQRLIKKPDGYEKTRHKVHFDSNCFFNLYLNIFDRYFFSYYLCYIFKVGIRKNKTVITSELNKQRKNRKR